MKNFKSCKYTYLHRIALRYYIQNNKYLTEKEKEELLKRAEVHDMDKLTLYLFWEKKDAHNYHVQHASHHIKHKDKSEYTEMDMLESLFDYECAALTKPDKPLNANDTVEKFYPNKKDEYKELLERLHMNSSYLAYNEKDKAYIEQFDITEEDILHAVATYLKTTPNNVYDLLKDKMCTPEEYEELLKH